MYFAGKLVYLIVLPSNQLAIMISMSLENVANCAYTKSPSLEGSNGVSRG